MSGPNFALYYAGDAYSTAAKIMGRQSAGKALMKGVARRWPDGEIHGFGPNRAAGKTMAQQLKRDGHEGLVRWRPVPGDAVLEQVGAVYYPAPVTQDLAHIRNTRGPTAYSLFGVTHTLSSEAGMDSLSKLVLAPFQAWDGLICTSSVALSVAHRLQAEMREWQIEHVGATRFNTPSMKIIPLGVDAPACARTPAQIEEARTALGIKADEVAFLFAGRLIFHAKANPAVYYRAVEAAQARVAHPIVCIEAGVFPNDSVADGYRRARADLAPSIRFIEVDGADSVAYDRAWKAADVFTSLSDNIQETFGLTPVEAMAAGLPNLVSDWNGYKDTVRDGIDGLRIPTLAPGPRSGAGSDLAQRHATGADNYDFFIGRASMATVVAFEPLVERIVELASNPDLRRRMGEAGRARAVAEFDWPVILDRYCDFAAELGELRRAAATLRKRPAIPFPIRPDPFVLFQSYPTHHVGDDWKIEAVPLDDRGLDRFLGLHMARYVIDDQVLPEATLRAVHSEAAKGGQTVGSLLNGVGRTPASWKALMWLMKLDIVRAAP
ncbi:MAG: glycosyltransferase family 4 protein [Brevundimonas sp.]|nr:glycosyltransferase family 4 protein [Brevundimonas sp.]